MPEWDTGGVFLDADAQFADLFSSILRRVTLYFIID
jgi:hypothetical protein